jgi:hypothetical protein
MLDQNFKFLCASRSRITHYVAAQWTVNKECADEKPKPLLQARLNGVQS